MFKMHAFRNNTVRQEHIGEINCTFLSYIDRSSIYQIKSIKSNLLNNNGLKAIDRLLKQ